MNTSNIMMNKILEKHNETIPVAILNSEGYS